MKRGSRRGGCSLILTSLLGFAASGAALPAGPEPATAHHLDVAAASDLKFAMDELVVAFGKARADVTVSVSYGSSGNFLSQIQNGAPFDLFFSADIDYPRRLAEAGLAAKGSEFPYAVGRIVVWVPAASSIPVERGLQALTAPEVRRIAIANPTHAPYGRAAEAALRKLGVYDSVKDKLVFGENVAQTAQFVQSGAADAGIIALSLAIAPALAKEGRYFEVPLDAYPRMEQGGIILNRAQHSEAARAFRDFVLGDEGHATLKRYGFFIPG
jgi:molybdate transport system substrate-binding protein